MARFIGKIVFRQEIGMCEPFHVIFYAREKEVVSFSMQYFQKKTFINSTNGKNSLSLNLSRLLSVFSLSQTTNNQFGMFEILRGNSIVFV